MIPSDKHTPSDTSNLNLDEEILFIDQTLMLAIADDDRFLYICAMNAVMSLAAAIKPSNAVDHLQVRTPEYADSIDSLFAPKPVVQVPGQPRKLTQAERWLCEYMRIIEDALNAPGVDGELDDLLNYLAEWEDGAIFRSHYHSNTVLEGIVLLKKQLAASRKNGIDPEFRKVMKEYALRAKEQYASGKSTGFTDIYNSYD